jgi:HSP20 family protein
MQLMRREDRWDPLRELDELFGSRLNRMFGRSAVEGDREALALTDWAPSCNISETEAEYRIKAELPGVERNDVHVTLEDGVLTLEGDRKEEKEEKSGKNGEGTRFHRKELAYGHFLRRFTMPDDAEESKVAATFKDGILDVSIGRSKSKQPKARQIPVH